MNKSIGIENVIARSQPEHQRSEARMQFDHSLRKPRAKVERAKKKWFDLSGPIDFYLLDISPNGACLIDNSKLKKKPEFLVNDEILITLNEEIEVIGEIRWVVSDYDLPQYYKEKKLAIGVFFKNPIPKSKIFNI